MNRSSRRSLCESGSGPGRDVMVGLAQRISATAEHLLVEGGRSVHFLAERAGWLALAPRLSHAAQLPSSVGPLLLNEFIGESSSIRIRQPVLARRRHRLPRPVGWRHYRRAGGMLFRAKAVAFCSPRHGDTSATVGGMRSCRAAWSARHPVKVEVAGSNPVRTAGISGEASLGSQPGQVAQLV